MTQDTTGNPERTAKLLDGKATASAVRDQIGSAVAEFHARTGLTPRLAAVLVGDDPASAVYIRNKQKACAAAGIESSLDRLPEETSEQQLLDVIEKHNTDPAVHGILVQLPLPRHIGEQRILDAVNPAKDVDCFHPTNVGLLSQGRPRFLPCTPHGVQELLAHHDISVAGKHAVVIGRSEIVGKPIAMMLAQRGARANATVTVCHSGTGDLTAITRQADVLIVAIGAPQFVTADMVKPGAVVVDVGINRVDGKLVGDVDFTPVAAKASAITPVPGGVGPMTIAMLLQNTLRAAELAADAGAA